MNSTKLESAMAELSTDVKWMKQWMEKADERYAKKWVEKYAFAVSIGFVTTVVGSIVGYFFGPRALAVLAHLINIA